jgi:hypothetical protein
MYETCLIGQKFRHPELSRMSLNRLEAGSEFVRGQDGSSKPT